MKDVSAMTAGELNKALDSLDKKDSKVNAELIASGRGNELYQDVLKKSDALSKKATANYVRRMELRREIDSRYGPGAPSRMPTRRQNPKRKKNAPLRRAKIVLGAIAKSGKKTQLWFDGKHFRSKNVKRVFFATPKLAKSVGMILLQDFPILRKYHVGVYRV